LSEESHLGFCLKGLRGILAMDDLLSEAAGIIYNSKLTLALTGAGISVESGIPDFRSHEGLWARYDPEEYATISAFRENSLKVWEMLKDMAEVLEKARPNRAHLGLGELERLGFLHHIITQNIDRLHQAGGSRNVIEYHGNPATLSCLWCGRRYSSEEKKGEYPPKCLCDKALKPDVVFFGEPISGEVLHKSSVLITYAQALLVVGTSALVAPANTLPALAKENGAKIIEINRERTELTANVTDVFLQGEAGELITALVSAVKHRAGKRLIVASENPPGV
jgi:NAD-dependent deacetylase